MLNNDRLFVVTDNDGVDGWSGETWFFGLGPSGTVSVILRVGVAVCLRCFACRPAPVASWRVDPKPIVGLDGDRQRARIRYRNPRAMRPLHAAGRLMARWVDARELRP